MVFCCRLKCRMFHDFGNLYFNGRRLIPNRRCGDIIDRAPSIRPMNDVSYIEKNEFC